MQAVDDRIRDIDLLIARSLSAKSVFLSRLVLNGVAAAGRNGAQTAIDILKEEIDLAMGQIGCPDIEALPEIFPASLQG